MGEHICSPIFIFVYKKRNSMKHKFSLLISFCLYFLSACTSNQYKIEGKIHGDHLEDEKIYLVDLDPAQRMFIDSTTVKNRTFSFTGEIQTDKMMILRTRPILRMVYQEIVLVLEPGTISVYLDSISTATGTRQNDLLQQWKEKKEGTHTRVQNLKRWLRTSNEDLSSEEIQQIETNIQTIENEFIEYNYNFIQQHWHTTVGQFVYKMVGNSLNEEQQEVLKSLDIGE